MSGEQRQRAGGGSQQIQVAGDLIVQGLTEERATVIARIEAERVISEFTLEAQEVAGERIHRLGEKVVVELGQESLLSVFADPSFQILLRKAQAAAASTGESGDHDVITKLLVERGRRDTRRIRLAVERAIEIVDRIEQEALQGLTLLWFTLRLVAQRSTAQEYLAVMDGLAEKLCAEDGVPTGYAWLDDLDVLDCIRREQLGIGRMKTYAEVTCDVSPGIASVGFSEEESGPIIDRLEGLGIHGIVTEHPMLEDRFTIRFRTVDSVIDAARASGLISTDEKEAELRAIAVAARLSEVAPEAREKIDDLIVDDFRHLAELRKMWNGIPGTLSLTSVGTALAYSNAKRRDPLTGLPTLHEVLG